MDSPRYIIYALVDPRDGEIRYVGQSSTGFRRPSAHCWPSTLNGDLSHKANWIRQLQGLGLGYEVKILDQFENADQLNKAEMWWISFLRVAGANLTNITEGGDGVRGWKVSEEECERKRERMLKVWSDKEWKQGQVGKMAASHDQESDKRRSESMQKRWEDPTYREKVTTILNEPQRRLESSLRVKEKFLDPSYRAKHSEATKTAMARPEVKAKVELGNKTRGQDPAFQQKQSIAMQERWRDKEYRDRLIAASKKAHTPETYQKASASLKKRNEDPEFRVRSAIAHGGKPFVDESGAIYRTLGEASAATGASPANIVAVLKGRRPRAGGHSFHYLEEKNEL